jgi:Rod binding domain-containing protein
MNVHPISPATHSPEMPDGMKSIAIGKSGAPEKGAEAARQFEGILLRQFLSESMKPLLQGGPGGQVYGYLLTESLSSSLVKGGGLGLTSIIQAQFSQEPHR